MRCGLVGWLGECRELYRDLVLFSRQRGGMFWVEWGLAVGCSWVLVVSAIGWEGCAFVFVFISGVSGGCVDVDGHLFRVWGMTMVFRVRVLWVDVLWTKYIMFKFRYLGRK